MIDLAGNVAVVTGASQGIGRKIPSTKEDRIALKNECWECGEKDGEDWYFSKPK